MVFSAIIVAHAPHPSSTFAPLPSLAVSVILEYSKRRQEALAAYAEAQRLDPSTDEAMEQAERVKTLIAVGGNAAAPALAFPSALPEVDEEEEDIVAVAAAAAAAKAEAEVKEAMAAAAAKAAAEATKAAEAATAAAETAAALISPARRTAPAAGSGAAAEFVPGALALGVGEAGGVDITGGGGWGQLKSAAERDSDCMSVDTGLNQALLPVGLRWAQAGGDSGGWCHVFTEERFCG